MAHRNRRFLAVLLGVAVIVPLGLINNAFASDPLAGDAYAPDPNTTILMLYNFYHDDDRYGGQLGDPNGPDATKDTKIAADVVVPRILHAIDLDGYIAGAQAYMPYVTYLGDQHVGINDLGTPAPGLLPSLGPGRADLSHTDGFAQPNLAVFLFPINNKKTGTYLIIQPWISPPLSSFNKNNTLNPSPNVWTFTAEFGFCTLLLGTPVTQNLQLEVWQDTYLYANNTSSAFASPAISANNIPPIYPLAHEFFPQVPGTNPVRAASVTPATFREQPTTELRVYLTYEFVPDIHAYVSTGLYQSFGGKQTYKLNTGGIVDTGNRTNETQLRLILGSFITPSVQVSLTGDYDVAAHGGPYDRVIEFRLLKFFF